MTKKTAKPTIPESGPLFAFGLDDKGKPRGARFAKYPTALASAVLDMGLNFVLIPSPAFADAAKKLPEGRYYTSGKTFIPNIKQALLDELIAIVSEPGDKSQFYRLEQRPNPDTPTAGDPVRCVSPITSACPEAGTRSMSDTWC